MSLTSERNHEKRLNELNIRIKTLYSDGDKIYEKNTDNSKNDNLERGIRVEKDYYVNNKLKKKIYGFDPRIEYSFINSQQIGTDYTCPNCGMTARIDETLERCPYCDAYFNLDYKNKNKGSKITYDLVLHNRKYIIISLILSLIGAFVVSFLYFSHGRTFNGYDIAKTVGIGVGVAFALFLVFYLLDSLFVLLPIKIKKNKINKNDDDVWKNLDERNVNYNTFYNNLYYELDKYYFVELKSSVIDYDVIDFYNFKLVEDASNLYLSLDIIIREIVYKKNKFVKNTIIKKITLKKNNKPVVHTNDGEIHNIHCYNCGASIDVMSDKCKYCDTPNNYNQEWYLTKIS